MPLKYYLVTPPPSTVLKYCEILEVRSQKMTLEMTLSGVAVVPAVTSSHPGGVLDFGHVLQKECATHVLKVSPQRADRRGQKRPARQRLLASLFLSCLIQLH